MSKSSLRKDSRKLIKTKHINGWSQIIGVDAGVIETGLTIVSLPIKAELRLTHIQMWAEDNGSLTSDRTNVFGVTIDNDAGLPLKTLDQIVESSFAVINQRFIVQTAVGIVQGGNQLIDDLDAIITRQTNLVSAFEIAVVPWYRSDASINLSTRGLLSFEMTLFQDQVADSLDEWNGYTFEESAQ